MGPVDNWSDTYYWSYGMSSDDESALMITRVPEFYPFFDSDIEIHRCAFWDPDGDGDLDIFADVYYPDEFDYLEIPLLLENVSSGREWSVSPVGTSDILGASPRLLTLDIDSDGRSNLVYRAGNRMLWLRSAEYGWIEHYIGPDGTTPLCLIDYDSDGDQDIVGAVRYSDATLFEMENGFCTRYFQIHDDRPPYYQNLFSCDQDSDGDPDLLWYNRDEKRFEWLENTYPADSIWILHEADSVPSRFNARFLDDFDQDGDIDACGWLPDNVLTLLRNEGNGNWEETTIEIAQRTGRLKFAADMDADGDPDLVGEDSWWENRPDSEKWHHYSLDQTSPGTDFDAIWAIDLTGDGLADLVSSTGMFDLNTVSPGVYALASSILDTGYGSLAGLFEWEATIPDGTSMFIQIRASDDDLDLGQWSSPLVPPFELDEQLPDGGRYFQYLVLMYSEDGLSSPVLKKVMITP